MEKVNIVFFQFPVSDLRFTVIEFGREMLRLLLPKEEYEKLKGFVNREDVGRKTENV